MNSAGDGFVHIADDGVVRAYAANGTVIDYVKLSNSQLRAFVDSLPPSIQDQREHLLDIWGDVDGNKVTDEGQIWYVIDEKSAVLCETLTNPLTLLR